MRFPGVIPAVVTPFDENGQVDGTALAANAARLLDEGCTGLVGTATMGEAQSLSAVERRRVIETLVDVAAEHVTVTAGIAGETAAVSIGHAADAAAVGAGALLLLPPLGYAGDERELEAFYRAVCETTGLPVVISNDPTASGTDMAPGLIARLAEIEGVAAVEERSGDVRRIAALVNDTGLEVLVGGDDGALEGFAAGARGWISGVANVAPRSCVELFELCETARLEEARALYARLLPLCRLDIEPKLVQHLKAAMDLVGRAGGPSRPPRLELAPAEHAEVEQAVRALGVELLR